MITISMTMQKKVNLEGKLAKSVHEDDHDADGDGDDDDDDDDHDVANLEAKWAKPVHGRSDYQSP